MDAGDRLDLPPLRTRAEMRATLAARLYGPVPPPPDRLEITRAPLAGLGAERIVLTLTQGDRVFHQKFGYGAVREIEGDKLTIDFEKAGEKKVVASYVSAADDIPF